MTAAQKTLSISNVFSLKNDRNYSYAVHNKSAFGSEQADAAVASMHRTWGVCHHHDKFLYCFLNECYN